MMNKIFQNLNDNDIFAIPVGMYFDKPEDACYLVYSPLANIFYLSLPKDIMKLEEVIQTGETTDLLNKLLDKSAFKDIGNNEVSTDSFCTLHLLLNEKCNFHCKYCYSAEGRSSAELNMEKIKTTLDYFLSSERTAVKDRTIMFMGGGEPVLSWNLLEESTLYAEDLAKEQDVKVHFSLTTNGSIMTDEMLDFMKEHNFTVQISFEILPEIQNAQRGSYDAVSRNLVRLTEKGINNYVRSTITELNVDRIPEMVEHCNTHFPLVKKMSCQQVVDPSYFTNEDKVNDFFDRYFISYHKAEEKANGYGITLRSSSSHLLNYSKRERFCYNLLCLTPYGTLTICPDVSSPNERDYDSSVIGKLENDSVKFDQTAFARLSNGSIHTIEKCRTCYARWNCGSGCPSSRRVYSVEIFDAICNHYRKMLCHSLISALAEKYIKATGRDFYEDIKSKL
ncbi:MAG: radical SAM protein [Bacteroidales bacterium]|nr:radical SAM protein [Bacteroidales bacterium]